MDAPTGAPDDAPDGASEQEEQEQPKPPTRILLVRHAVTAQTGPLLSGRAPGINLSDRGVEQADAAAKRLAVLPIAAVYASPIERTTQTAEKIASHHQLTVEPLPGVVEADYGDWTGQKLADLAKTPEWSVVQVTPSRAQFPNGETILAMQSRTVAAIEQIVRRHPHETIVIVSHADPIKSAIAYFTGMHLDLFQRLHVSPASVTVLEFHRFGATLVKSNDTGGLDDLLPAPEAPTPPENDAEQGPNDG
jgi:probable phosphoglycerate mutase